MDESSEALFSPDPFWKEVERQDTEEGHQKPRTGYVGCPMSWLKRVLPLVNSPDQLLIAMLMYSQLRWDKAVPVPNSEFDGFGIGRNTKYRVLNRLEQAGLIALERVNGRTIGVRLILGVPAHPICAPVGVPREGRK